MYFSGRFVNRFIIRGGGRLVLGRELIWGGGEAEGKLKIWVLTLFIIICY